MKKCDCCGKMIPAKYHKIHQRDCCASIDVAAKAVCLSVRLEYLESAAEKIIKCARLLINGTIKSGGRYDASLVVSLENAIEEYDKGVAFFND